MNEDREDLPKSNANLCTIVTVLRHMAEGKWHRQKEVEQIHPDSGNLQGVCVCCREGDRMTDPIETFKWKCPSVQIPTTQEPRASLVLVLFKASFTFFPSTLRAIPYLPINSLFFFNLIWYCDSVSVTCYPRTLTSTENTKQSHPCTDQCLFVSVPDFVSSSGNMGILSLSLLPCTMLTKKLEMFPAHIMLPLISDSISIINEFFKSSITGLLYLFMKYISRQFCLNYMVNWLIFSAHATGSLS